jgi:hypothetical protein
MQVQASGWIKGGAALVALEALALLVLAAAAVVTLHSDRLVLGATNAASPPALADWRGCAAGRAGRWCWRS